MGAALLKPKITEDDRYNSGEAYVGGRLGPPRGQSKADEEYDLKDKLIDPWVKLIRAEELRTHRRRQAEGEHDYSLAVLGSTSPAWRNIKQYERLEASYNRRRSWQDKIDDIWKKPLDWVRGQLSKLGADVIN